MKPIIGLEIHVQLNTDTKLFCSCTTQAKKPNSACCPVCLGMPGSKPVLNKLALDYGLRLALALKCKIAKQAIFSRKTYFYPDMSKNYQITQYEIPLGFDGYLEVNGKKIRIKRIHLEEDPASLIHKGSIVLIDYNRSGIPLVEIVTQPDLNSASEARDFLKKLVTVLNYLGVYDENKCVVKTDANISLEGHARVEIKNISGFKEIENALAYEIERQKHLLKEGQEVTRETRGWDADKGVTFFQRSKELEEEYGYIVDTDLVPIGLSKDLLAKVKEQIPELAHEKVERFIKQYKIKRDDAEALASELLLADLFEKVAKEINPILAARWLRIELVRVLHYNEIDLHKLEIDEAHLIELLKLVESKQITEPTAKRLLEMLIEKPFSPKEYVEKHGLKMISSSQEIEKLCKEAIEANPKAVEDYKTGNEKALHFIAGYVMKLTKGKAKPQEVYKILDKLLKG